MSTALHYADNLEFPRNAQFRKRYALTYKANADAQGDDRQPAAASSPSRAVAALADPARGCKL